MTHPTSLSFRAELQNPSCISSSGFKFRAWASLGADGDVIFCSLSSVLRLLSSEPNLWRLEATRC